MQLSEIVNSIYIHTYVYIQTRNTISGFLGLYPFDKIAQPPSLKGENVKVIHNLKLKRQNQKLLRSLSENLMRRFCSLLPDKASSTFGTFHLYEDNKEWPAQHEVTWILWSYCNVAMNRLHISIYQYIILANILHALLRPPL